MRAGSVGGPVVTGSARIKGSDQDVQQVVDADADLVSRQTDDAGIPWPEHLDLHATAQAELLQPMDMIRPADDVNHTGRLPCGKVA
jgi:hypothetical protein